MAKPFPSVKQVAENLLPKLLNYPDDELCWIWTGGLRPTGYPTWGWSPEDHHKKTITEAPYRLVYALHTGIRLPETVTLDHLCRIRACCNPLHLEPCSREENSERVFKEVCECGLKRDLPRADGRHVCPKCDRENNRRKYHRLQAEKLLDAGQQALPLRKVAIERLTKRRLLVTEEWVRQSDPTAIASFITNLRGLPDDVDEPFDVTDNLMRLSVAIRRASTVIDEWAGVN